MKDTLSPKDEASAEYLHRKEVAEEARAIGRSEVGAAIWTWMIKVVTDERLGRAWATQVFDLAEAFVNEREKRENKSNR